MTITANQTNIDVFLNIEPGDPVDVIQNGNVTTSFSGFNHDFTSGACDLPIIGDIIGLFLPDIENLAEGGIANFLNAVDANGNTVLADAFEVALTSIDITGPIGGLLQADLTAPLSVAWAADDRFFPLEHGRRIARQGHRLIVGRATGDAIVGANHRGPVFAV